MQHLMYATLVTHDDRNKIPTTSVNIETFYLNNIFSETIYKTEANHTQSVQTLYVNTIYQIPNIISELHVYKFARGQKMDRKAQRFRRDEK